MVAIKKIFGRQKNNSNNNDCNIQGRTLGVRYMNSYTPSDTFATLPFAKLLRLLACRLKYCRNGRDKEKKRVRCPVAEMICYKAAEAGEQIANVT